MDIKQLLSAITARQGDADRYGFFGFGHAYYISRNTAIMNRSKKVLWHANDPKKAAINTNPLSANHKVPSGHFKKIVLQKVLYSLGNGVLFNDKGQSDVLNRFFPEITFDEFMIAIAIEASKKGEAWAYAYMDAGKLVVQMADVSQLTPIYDEHGKLVLMLKSFSENGKHVIHAFDDTGFTRYEGKNGKYTEVGRFGHYTETEMFNGEPTGQSVVRSFSSIPFIPLYNNDEKLSDLFPIKPLIDVYDIIHSDFANNIDDMQDIYMTIKGYSGTATDLAEFIQQLKVIKAVPVGDEGDVQTHQAEVPVQARETYLKRLENDIYNFAMGVNLKNMEGGSITNVYIKAQFADLDLKCDQFESELRKFVNKLLRFFNENAGVTLDTDYNFVRSTIINEAELVDSAIKLTGLLSDETVRELLPYSIDAEQEAQRLQEQNAGVKLTGVVNEG